VGFSGAGGQGDVPTSGSAGATAGGEAGTAGSSLDPIETNWEGAPIYTRFARLTSSQWEHAVNDILRLSPPSNFADAFEPASAGTTDFTNNERLLFVDPRQFADFEAAAEAAAALATGSASALAALSAETTREGFVRVLGMRAFRRPLTHDEEVKYQQVFTQGETLYGAGFANGASLVIRAMLQSPQFLYRSELGPAGAPLSAYELASKLSFWLLDTTPSDALLDAAGAGKLDSIDALEATARQMLEDPRARNVMRDFHEQLYHLDAPWPDSWAGVPEYTDALHAELVESSYRFFDDVFSEDLGLRELLTSKRAFVGPNLAPLYGIVPAPSAIEARVLGPSRIGYFMQVPFLLLNGTGRDPDSIHRGTAVELNLLCGLVSFLPLTVSIPPLAPKQTNRQRISALTDSCGFKCHRDHINALGFAFENFDGLGQERRTDNGEPVDTSGSYPFAEGVKNFANAKELMTILASSTQAQTCYAKKMTSYALQRDIVERDSAFVETLGKVNRSQSIKDLVVSLIKAPAFRVREAGNP
jgi:uncharacterized protein DUF1592/uncharacterized protein DUF1595/uncharacterized protein DUF1588/uncharacterized protein DUF1585/uncharacterized protein DUF1587